MGGRTAMDRSRCARFLAWLHFPAKLLLVASEQRKQFALECEQMDKCGRCCSSHCLEDGPMPLGLAVQDEELRVNPSSLGWHVSPSINGDVANYRSSCATCLSVIERMLARELLSLHLARFLEKLGHLFNRYLAGQAVRAWLVVAHVWNRARAIDRSSSTRSPNGNGQRRGWNVGHGSIPIPTHRARKP